MRHVRMYNSTHRFDMKGATGPTASPNVRWTHEIQRLSDVAVWDGQVYCTTEAGSVFAFTLDGDPQWRLEVGPRLDGNPAVVDGTVYLGRVHPRGEVVALDAATGGEHWRFETDDGVHSSPAVVDGTVYVGSFDGNVYALNAADGAER